MVIAVDFDGTVVTHEYPNIGRDIGAVPVLTWLIEEGHRLILNTMRCGDTLEAAVAWFGDRRIPLYGINVNPEQRRWTESPKAYAHVYIDDAALGVPLLYRPELSERPYVDWQRVREILEHGGFFIEKIKPGNAAAGMRRGNSPPEP
jgi:hypothetical protein